jgi:hypothetical protein
MFVLSAHYNKHFLFENILQRNFDRNNIVVRHILDRERVIQNRRFSASFGALKPSVIWAVIWYNISLID